jgi:thioredoxin reductase (NADPH)
MNKVKVYGADWCGDTQRTRERLDNMGVGHDYINVEQDKKASDWVKERNEGKERKPTVAIGDHVLSVPTDEELENALREQGIVS